VNVEMCEYKKKKKKKSQERKIIEIMLKN
jgi:hypothetical protein